MAARRALGLLLLGALIPVLSCGSSSSSGGEGATVSELVGAVTVNGKAATKGQTLAAGDQLDVPQNAATRLKYPDGSTVMLAGKTAEGTRLTIGAEKTDGALKVMLLKLSRGVLGFVVPSSAHGKSRYEFEALSSLTVVRGTQGIIDSSDQRDVVSLRDGTVDVESLATHQKGTIVKGQEITVKPDGTVGAPGPHDMSADPAEVSGATILLKQFGQ